MLLFVYYPICEPQATSVLTEIRVDNLALDRDTVWVAGGESGYIGCCLGIKK